MNFNNIKNDWQGQSIQINGSILDKTTQRDDAVRRENLFVTILFASTIFILGNVVFPFISDDQGAMLSLGGVMFLLGCQALIFWMRNFANNAMANKNSKEQLNSIKNKLRYQLLVTNLFMPIYFILLSVLIYSYITHLEALPDNWKMWVLIPFGTFMLSMFLFGWFKQRKKDQAEVIPLLEEVKEELSSLG